MSCSRSARCCWRYSQRIGRSASPSERHFVTYLHPNFTSVLQIIAGVLQNIASILGAHTGILQKIPSDLPVITGDHEKIPGVLVMITGDYEKIPGVLPMITGDFLIITSNHLRETLLSVSKTAFAIYQTTLDRYRLQLSGNRQEGTAKQQASGD